MPSSFFLLRASTHFFSFLPQCMCVPQRPGCCSCASTRLLEDASSSVGNDMAKAASEPALRARLATATLIVRFIVSSLDAHTYWLKRPHRWSPFATRERKGNPAGFLGGGRAVVIFFAV